MTSKARVPAVQKLETALILGEATRSYHKARLALLKSRQPPMKTARKTVESVLKSYDRGCSLLLDLV
jgi:hypothetical protein